MVTLKDIARTCGVSTATVSYVVNNGPRPVLPATRERIQKAIDELGYHPNAHARGLRGMRTETVGVIFPQVTLPFENVYFGPVVEGIVAGTTERRLAAMLFTGLTWNEAEVAAPKLCDGRCDGFIMVAPLSGSRLLTDLVARKVPLVVVGTHPGHVQVTTVDSNNKEGGRIATQHLLSLGHRRIAFVTSWSNRTSSAERLEGYRNALSKAGIPFDPDLITEDASTHGGNRAVLRQLFSSMKELGFTAVFCTDDSVALDALLEAEEMGVRVPEDLSVIGFDDIRISASARPALTSVHQPLHGIGSKAVELLTEQISGKNREPHQYLYDVQLVPRASTRSIL